MRNFRSTWKQEAINYARQLWHVPKYRYFDARSATKQELADLAASVFRNRVNTAYRHSVGHPKSRKAVEEIRENARILGSIGLWMLEHGASL